VTRPKVVTLQPSTRNAPGAIVSDDIDLTQLNLNVQGRAARDIRSQITDGTITRTILGPSTVQITIRDPHLELFNSGYVPDFGLQQGAGRTPRKAAQTQVVLVNACDIKVDGVWFRLVQVSKQGLDVTLTFEDRAVAVLRLYPKPGAAHAGFMWRRVTTTTRQQFAALLVREPKELTIPFVSPGYTDKPAVSRAAHVPSQAQRDANREPGFGPGARITVKNRPADAAQITNIDLVLHTGWKMGARRKVLVAAICTITQESDCRVSATNGVHVGLFQQDPRYWAPGGSRDPVTDATQFFQRAIAEDQKRPADTIEDLCENVQNPGDSGPGNAYSQWFAEADRTVTSWSMPGGDGSTAADVAAANGSFVPTGGTAATSTQFEYTRGTVQVVNHKFVWTREDNWSCLSRLAAEVQWRCFADQGTVYFVDDLDLFRSRPLMTITEAASADQLPALPSGVLIVDSIDGDYDTGKRNAQLTVKVRLSRWAAPPGSMVAIEYCGPFSGRWLVQEIRRPLFSKDGTITLVKPQPALPESESPEWASTTSTGAKPIPRSLQPAGTVSDSVRNRIVAAAIKALRTRENYRYENLRPMPNGLFTGPYPEGIDCSSFFTLCWKAGGAPDPNGNGYNGAGSTLSLANNGQWFGSPLPGDACLYGPSRQALQTEAGNAMHVTVYIGDGQCIGMEGGGIVQRAVQDAGQFQGYVRFDDGSGIGGAG
jgi:cell wall-associated NlpC family hydrolase